MIIGRFAIYCMFGAWTVMIKAFSNWLVDSMVSTVVPQYTSQDVGSDTDGTDPQLCIQFPYTARCKFSRFSSLLVW